MPFNIFNRFVQLSRMAVVKDKEFMQCFWDLAADKVELRVESGSQLLTFLADGRDETYAAYTLQRLIRGLCSPRDSARLGFSVALTQYLSIYKPEVATVLDMLDKDTKVSSYMQHICLFITVNVLYLDHWVDERL